MATYKWEDGTSPNSEGLRGAIFKRVLTVEVRMYLDLSDDDGEMPFDHEELDFAATSEFSDMLAEGLKVVPSVLRVDVISTDHNEMVLDWEED